MTNTNKLCALALLSTLAWGCATEPTATETAFGDSVRQMVRAQIQDPATAQNPGDEAIDSTDGQKLEKVLEVHRGAVAEPSTVDSPIVINVGGNQ